MRPVSALFCHSEPFSCHSEPFSCHSERSEESMLRNERPSPLPSRERGIIKVSILKSRYLSVILCLFLDNYYI